MRFFSVSRTVACTDKVMPKIIDTYFPPNCTRRERACPADYWPPNVHSEETCMNRLSVVAVTVVAITSRCSITAPLLARSVKRSAKTPQRAARAMRPRGDKRRIAMSEMMKVTV